MALIKYTAAIIGTGRIGFTLAFDKKREQPASHTIALKKNKRIKLIAGADNASESIEYWHRFNKKSAAYSCTSQLFASCKPDIVVVAVNENAHLETTLAAINAKPKLIILEKPVALNMEQGKIIEEKALEQNVPILVNHERRFAFDYKIAKKYLKSIGKIQSVYARLDSGMRVFDANEEKTGNYSLIHDGTHLVDAVIYLLEDEEFCNTDLYNIKLSDFSLDEKNPKIVRNVCVHCSSRRCSDITLHFSGKSSFFGFEIDIVGTEGRVKIGNGIAEFYKRKESSMYTGFYSLVKDSSIKCPKKTGYFSNMIQNAVDFLDKKAELGSTLENGLNVLSVLEEIKEALKLEVC